MLWRAQQLTQYVHKRLTSHAPSFFRVLGKEKPNWVEPSGGGITANTAPITAAYSSEAGDCLGLFTFIITCRNLFVIYSAPAVLIKIEVMSPEHGFSLRHSSSQAKGGTQLRGLPG